MAKDKLTDYDATASNNTDIGGIDINQGTMIPSNVDNAIREIMSHLKDFAAGTQAVSSIAVSGDLTVDTTTLKVDSTNNRVGIGTSSPDASLHIEGSGVSALRFGNIGPSSNSAIRLSRDDITVTSGNPLGYLQFGGNDSTSNTDAAFAYVSGEASGTHGAGDNPTDLTFGTTADGSSTPAERMRIDSSGNVGIGTTSPSSSLHMEKSETTAYDGSATDGQLGVGTTLFLKQSGLNNNAVSQIVFQPRDAQGFNRIVNTGGSAPKMAFVTDDAERMRIDSSGNVMVGRTSGSSTTEDAGLVLSTSGYIYSARDGTSNRTHHLFINNAAVSATAVGSIKTSGSSTSYNTTSDYRLKENVADLTGAITRIKNLSPKRFNFTGFTDTVDGFLAHEAQTVVPEAVHGTHNETEAIGDLKDADGNVTENKVVKPDTLQDGYTWTETGTQPVYQGIDQAKLVPVLTAALQEAIAKIEALETQNADLETKVADLETKVADFETRLTALEG